MDHSQIILAVIGMAVVTLTCRFLPFAILGKVAFSPAVAMWMRYLPVAILSAVVVPALVMSKAEMLWGPVSLAFLGAIPVVVIAFRTRNLLASVSVGVITVAVLRSL